MAKSDKKFLTIFGSAIAIVVLFFVLLINPGDELNYDTFVIVREHSIGTDPSNDDFYAHNYGLSFMIFGGVQYSTKIISTRSSSVEGCKAKLATMLKDKQEEWAIIEMVDRNLLM